MTTLSVWKLVQVCVYEAVEGEQGLQASTVQIVDKPGAHPGKSDETLLEPPLGWK